MKRIVVRYWTALSLMLAGLAGATRADAQTLWVVRHADKDVNGHLVRPEGETRARELGEFLKDKGITHVYYDNDGAKDPLDRVRRTAEIALGAMKSSADEAKRGTLPAEPEGMGLRILDEKVKALGPEDRVLVVLHHDDIPAFVQERAGGELKDYAIGNREYDRIFELTRDPDRANPPAQRGPAFVNKSGRYGPGPTTRPAAG